MKKIFCQKKKSSKAHHTHYISHICLFNTYKTCNVGHPICLTTLFPAVGMDELQVIKKELTLIKTQIDGLLDSLDKMDTQRSDHKGETLIQEDSGGR